MRTIQQRIQEQQDLITVATFDLALHTTGTETYAQRAKVLREAKAWLVFLQARAARSPKPAMVDELDSFEVLDLPAAGTPVDAFDFDDEPIDFGELA